METKMNRKGWWLVSLSVLLSAFLISGCPKSKQAVTPAGEEKKETTAPVSPSRPEKEAGPTKPTSTPPTSAPEKPGVPSETKETQAIKEAPAPAPEPPHDPIASGATLLNPAVPEDARMIQARLAEIGLYKSSIDGIWGKGSRLALKAFKEKNSLARPDKWDKETQILLFQGASPNLLQAGGASQSSISSGETLLNPIVPQDAQMIQTRLAELGLYKASIDGIWGKQSEAALKAFKEKNSLANPDKWDKETQMLLFR